MMNDGSVREAFFNLGKAMRNYVLTIFIGGLLTVVISVGAMMTLFNSIYSENMPSLSFLIVPIVIIVAYVITIFVLYCLFLSTLGKVSKLTGIPQLQKAYTYYLWAFLSQFIIFGIIIIVVVSMIASTFSSILYDSGSGDSIMSVFMGSFITYMIVIIVAAILPVILKIIGVLSLTDWAVYSYQSNTMSPYLRQVKEGSDLMKWGTILSVIPYVSSIAGLLELIGMYQVGANLMKEYQLENSMNSSQFQSYVPPSQPTQVTQRISSNYPQYTTTTPTSYPSQTTKIRFCPHCGGNLETLGGNPRFCPSCGRNL